MSYFLFPFNAHFFHPSGRDDGHYDENAPGTACLRIKEISAPGSARLRTNNTTRYSSPAIRSPAGPVGDAQVSDGGNYGHASRAPQVSSHPHCAGCGSRSIPRARPSKMAGNFFACALQGIGLHPFLFVWTKRNGWNDNGLIYLIWDNVEKPARRLRDNDIFMSLSGATLLVIGNCAPAYNIPAAGGTTPLRPGPQKKDP